MDDTQGQISRNTDGTYNIDGFGRFGTIYCLNQTGLEMLFVAIGSKIEEIKGGVTLEDELDMELG